jgi:protein-S-isoprenylcysteine O-methyltransferase Ste14
MNGFDFVPVISFLILIFLIYRKTTSLKREGISVSSDKTKKKKSLFLIYPVFTLILFLWILEIIKPIFPMSFSLLPERFTDFLIYSLAFQITGTFIIILGLVFLFTALFHFKKSFRFGLSEINRGALITTGIFSITRNPFFLSLDIYFIGFAFLLPSPFLIGFSIVAVISIHFYILKEEKFMLKMYGEEYQKYTQKVNRYF